MIMEAYIVSLFSFIFILWLFLSWWFLAWPLNHSTWAGKDGVDGTQYPHSPTRLHANKSWLLEHMDIYSSWKEEMDGEKTRETEPV